MATAKYGALFPHVAPRSRELIHILVHGASNLPKIDGHFPISYVTAQTHTNLVTQDVGTTINATNYIEGISPYWNEMIYVETSEDNSHTEEIIILVIDHTRQINIVQHRLPWRCLQPFYQYHLNLQYTLKQSSQITSLYISIMRKLSSLSKENIRYFGLEVLLDKFDVPLTNNQSIYAVARIVPEYRIYKRDHLNNQQHSKLGVEFKKINSPTDQDFVVSDYPFSGYPQLSLTSKDSKIPIWKFDYLFSHENEKNNMFTTGNAALVIEFYPFQNIANNTNWRISGLLGWIAILLDGRTQDALASKGSVQGMRTEGLIVESEGDLTADNAKYLTASVVLRLINERHPAKNLLVLYGNMLPILPSYCNEEARRKDIDPVYLQVPGSKETFLPAIQPLMKQTKPVTPIPAPVRHYFSVI